MRAKAVVFSDKRKVEYGDVTVPEPGPHDVMVQTRYSWISNGTEGSFLRGERINGETPYRRGDPWPFPIVPGYQSSGVVMHVGRDVDDLRPGQWVFCTLGRIEGMYEPWGGHISPKIVDRSQVWVLPEGVSPIAASGLVLTQVGYNCGTRPPVRVGEMGLVIGDGLLGHWTAQTLHWRGMSVILAGKHHERLGLLPEGEGRYRVNILEEDLVEATRRLAPDGIHVLVDTVGSIATILQCHGLMRPNGHIVSAGFHGTDSMLDIQRLRFGELTLHSPSGWERRRMDETLALIASGHLQTERLITHRFPAEHAAEAWRLILEGAEPALGVVLTWAEDLSCRAEIAKHVGEQVGRGVADKSKGKDRERAPMKALEIIEPGRFKVREVPIPKPGPRGVLVKVLAVTTCPHWDLHIFGGQPMFPGAPLQYPYTVGQPGHEACGEVVAVGGEVREVSVGQRVGLWRDPGHHVPGCYAEFVARPVEDVIPVPSELPPEACAPLELAMCVSAHVLFAEKLDAISDKRVGVFGLGPAGLVFVQLLWAAGAAEVIGFDPLPTRRELAQRLGADAALDPTEDLLDRFPKRGQADCLHCVFDCVGSPDVVHQAMKMTSHLVVLFAVQREPYVFAPRSWGGLTLAGTQPHTREAAEYAVARLVDGRLDLGALVTDVMRLEEYARAVDLLRHRKAVKVAFLPQES